VKHEHRAAILAAQEADVAIVAEMLEIRVGAFLRSSASSPGHGDGL